MTIEHLRRAASTDAPKLPTYPGYIPDSLKKQIHHVTTISSTRIRNDQVGAFVLEIRVTLSQIFEEGAFVLEIGVTFLQILRDYILGKD